ncbi:helix-turn-helix domain-containing protein [Verrucomicrobiaceae bacterium N1E253]|uniref:Helix-turn-helix domain-containing protein n=1 Tax=Oceaniferula marina TaxID=2748318 RepID=A0A851GFQ9_9BACT|nr:helix-turn-helix domain-containing protein [Oceaniferula marina]NWK56236.1 helix-turn-helix domain-containing protein [Oceaniferula marina]
MNQHIPTPYPFESALRLSVGQGKVKPISGETGESPHRRRTYRPSGTPDWHIMVVLEGCFTVYPDAEESFSLEPNEAVLIPPHMKQDTALDDQFSEGSYFWAHFHPEVSMMPFLEWPKTSIGPGFLSWKKNNLLIPYIRSACYRCSDYFDSDFSRRRSLALLTLEEILRLIYQVNPTSSLDGLDDRVATALQYIATNIQSPINAKSIAGAVGLSASRFSDIFTRNMHCGVMEFVERQRLSKARNLLAQTQLPIAVIAENCGFSSSYYFSKRFNKHHQISPSAYRQSATESTPPSEPKPSA